MGINLKKYKVSEITEIIGGGTPKTSISEYWNGNIPWLSVVDFCGDQKKVYKTEKTITEKGLNESSTKVLRKGQLIISARGTVGELGMLGKDMAFNQSCYGLNGIRGKITNDFLYYLIIYNLDSIKRKTHGAVFDTITKQTFDQIEVDVPDLPTQTRIASILSSLDDKIELNRRMNHTLEQMAQALFNHYFVDNIDPDNLPEGWRIGKMGEILELKYGKPLKEKQRNKGNYAVVGSGGIIGYHDEFICKGKGIVVGRKGNSGAVSWLHENFYPIDTTFYVSDSMGVKDLYYHYFLLKSLNLKNLNSDSAVPGLNRNEAHNQEIVISEIKNIIEFNNSVSSSFNKINNNLNEIKTLIIIRDTLLPKLMSGEIDVHKK